MSVETNNAQAQEQALLAQFYATQQSNAAASPPVTPEGRQVLNDVAAAEAALKQLISDIQSGIPGPALSQDISDLQTAMSTLDADKKNLNPADPDDKALMANPLYTNAMNAFDSTEVGGVTLDKAAADPAALLSYGYALSDPSMSGLFNSMTNAMDKLENAYQPGK